MLELTIVRIISSEYAILGSGFLINNKYVFTCAHVIEDEIKDKDDITNNVVGVNFPLITDKSEKVYEAVVRYYHPVKEKRGRNDVALLQLQETPNEIQETKATQLVYLVPYYGSDLSARAYGFPEDSEDGRWVDVNFKGPSGERLQFSSNDPIKLGFSGAALFDSKRENIVIGMIATKNSVQAGFAIPADYLNDILRNIQNEDSFFEAKSILDQEKKENERILRMAFEEFVRTVFDQAHNRTQLPNNGHSYMRHREILVYGWLLQKRFGTIIKKDLYKYVGERQKTQIERFLLRDVPREAIEEDEDEFLRFSKDFMSSIELKGLSDPPIMNKIPYFGEITGYDILRYFMEMETHPNLDMIITQAFISSLNAQLGSIKKASGLTFSEIVSRTYGWKFIVVVDTNDSVYTVEDLRSIVADSVSIRKNENTPILLFAPNSEDITFLGETEFFYRIYHVWSISIARLFTRLDKLIKAKQQEKVAEYFEHFFPEGDSSDFKAGEWISRLEQAIP